MYWTEWGKAAMLITAKMNGFDLRPLLTTGLEWPNGLFYDAEKDKVYVADGAKLKIQSISPIGKCYQDIKLIEVEGLV